MHVFHMVVTAINKNNSAFISVADSHNYQQLCRPIERNKLSVLPQMDNS